MNTFVLMDRYTSRSGDFARMCKLKQEAGVAYTMEEAKMCPVAINQIETSNIIGGDKRKQQADINTALAYWRDWKKRSSP